MKRTFLLPALLLSLAFPARAQEATLDQFQAEIKRTYHQYEKEGVGEFTCGLESALVEKKLTEAGLDGFSQGLAKMALGLEFSLSYGPKGVKVTCPESSSAVSGEKGLALREGKEKARYWLEKGLGAWLFLSHPRGAERLDPSLETPSLTRTQQGWKLSLQRGQDQAVLYFNPTHTLTHADLYPQGEKPVRVRTTFAKTPKGLQLQACQALYEGKVYRAKMAYIKTRGALLPSTLVLTQVDPKSKAVSLLDTLTFENYEVKR